jgi:putative lipoprotein
MAVCVATVAGCAHQSRSGVSDTGTREMVTGTVTYRERVALPPDAITEVWAIDATIADAKAPPVASVTVPSQGAQVPLTFSMPYDPGRIDKSHLYTIRASIASKGEVLFSSDIARAVITQGNPTRVDLVLSRVDPTAASNSSDLPGSSWVLTDLQGAAIVADTRVTLDFSAPGRVTGTGSCNRYFSTVESSGSSIRFGAVGATRMACGTAVSLQEVKYFEALESANRFTVEDGVLSIYGGAPRPLRFKRAAP